MARDLRSRPNTKREFADLIRQAAADDDSLAEVGEWFTKRRGAGEPMTDEPEDLSLSVESLDELTTPAGIRAMFEASDPITYGSRGQMSADAVVGHAGQQDHHLSDGT